MERELLGVVFGLQKFEKFILGDVVTVQTDHKPLVSMYYREISASTRRQQRLLLKVHDYDVKLEYLRGKDNNIADALSRVSPLPYTKQDVEDTPQIEVHQITETMPASPSRLEKV